MVSGRYNYSYIMGFINQQTSLGGTTLYVRQYPHQNVALHCSTMRPISGPEIWLNQLVWWCYCQQRGNNKLGI